MYKCINEDLAVNGMEMRVNSIRVVITACLNASQISRIGVAMNRSAGGGHRRIQWGRGSGGCNTPLIFKKKRSPAHGLCDRFTRVAVVIR